MGESCFAPQMGMISLLPRFPWQGTHWALLLLVSGDEQVLSVAVVSFQLPESCILVILLSNIHEALETDALLLLQSRDRMFSPISVPQPSLGCRT